MIGKDISSSTSQLPNGPKISGEYEDLHMDQNSFRQCWRPSRHCVLAVLTMIFLTVLVYQEYLETTTSHNNPLQNHHPYSLEGNSVVSDLQGIEIAESVRIVRSYSERYYQDEDIPKARLTSLEEIIPNTQNIFFIETRCGTAKEMEQYTVDSGVVLNARQICSIESTARLNPTRPVYLLHTCPLDDNFPSKSPKYVRELLTYPNVHVVRLDLAELFNGSIVEQLYFGARFEVSRHPVEHVSDVVRLLVLWRFGGTYMDIDVISIRPLDKLGKNYAGWQDEYTIASGVLNFAPDGLGHQILSECLLDLRDNFQPDTWSSNGPILVTKTLMKLCGIRPGGEQSSQRHEFTDYPIPVFYPVYYTQWQLFFEEEKAKRTLNMLNDTYVVHIWNKMSAQRRVRVGSGQAYGLLADKYCPKAYRNCGPNF